MSTTTIERTVDSYVDELGRTSRSRSRETERTYRRILDLLCDEHPWAHPSEITLDDLRLFLDRWRGAAPATLALHISILNRFFDFCQMEGLVEANPMARIRRPSLPPVEDRDVVTVGSEDVKRMFNACEDWQELLTLAVLSYLGPRRSAAAALRHRDVDLGRGLMRFREKGRKVISKPIPHELVALLRAAWQSGEVPVGPEEYVIPNRRPKMLKRQERSSKIIWETVRRVAARAGVRSHVHALRAAFAVQFLESPQGSMKSLQLLLGHRRIETTQVYLRKLDREREMEKVRDLSWGEAAGFVDPERIMEGKTSFAAREAERIEGLRRDLVDAHHGAHTT